MFDSSSPIDFALQHQDPTHGIQALLDAGLDPAEEMMRKEEGEADGPGWDRVMVFRRFLVFCFAGSLDPVEWARRAMAVAREAHPAAVCRMALAEWDARCDELSTLAAPGVLGLVARKVGANRSVASAQGLLGGHAEMRDVVWPTAPDGWVVVLRKLLEDVFADGLDPERVAKRLAVFAHVMAARLLVGATCEEVGRIFDQCRASVSWRVRRVYNERVERAGGVAHAAFQKSASVVARYSDAQVGNRNRRKG